MGAADNLGRQWGQDYRNANAQSRLKKNYMHTKARGDLQDIQRNDRDRTTLRVELGVRAAEALRDQN